MFAGSERFLLDTLRWGGDGCISATVNVTARQTRDVYDLFAAGSSDADAAQAALTEARRFLEGYPAIPALKAIVRDRTGDDVWLQPAPAAGRARRSPHARAARHAVVVPTAPLCAFAH